MIIFANTHARFRGFFRLYTTNEYGKITKDTGFFPNLITNQGLDFIGVATSKNIAYGVQDFTACCSVGTGNQTPAYTDTYLQNWLACVYNRGGNGCSSNQTYNPGPPAYWEGQRSWQFAAGTATGNIAEIGVGTSPVTGSPSQSSDCPCFSRALVVDGGGSPTVIPVLATEALTVTYVLREYLDLTDTNYTMDISGTTYSGIFRRADVGTVPQLGLSIGSNVVNPSNGCTLYSGTIGSVTSNPTSAIYGYNLGRGSYTTGTYFIPISANFDINHGNSATGVTAIMWTATGAGSFQMSVSPAIPKTNAYNMTLNCNYSWSRYP